MSTTTPRKTKRAAARHSTVPLCRLTWHCCATLIMSPWRGESSHHPRSPTAPSTQDTGFNSPCSNCWEEESGQGRHSIPPRPPFGLDTKSTRKFAPTSCPWFTQTRKLFIMGQSKRAMGPGRSCSRAVLQMGSLMKELLSCSQAGEVAREKHNGLKAGEEELRRA